jgi:hypothetical protein
MSFSILTLSGLGLFLNYMGKPVGLLKMFPYNMNFRNRVIKAIIFLFLHISVYHISLWF